jgi:hypothetical protein
MLGRKLWNVNRALSSAAIRLRAAADMIRPVRRVFPIIYWSQSLDCRVQTVTFLLKFSNDCV